MIVFGYLIKKVGKRRRCMQCGTSFEPNYKNIKIVREGLARLRKENEHFFVARFTAFTAMWKRGR